MKEKERKNLANILKSAYIIFAVATISIGTTGSYFSDTAMITNNVISTGDTFLEDLHIVINEIYYDTDCRTYDDGECSMFESEGKNEWIELYNPTNKAVNIKNWSITGDSKPVIINPNVSIPAFGFALLSQSNNTWHYWGDPSGENIISVNLTGNVDRMSNSGDRIILKDDKGNIIDQLSYGDDMTIFDPSCIDVGEGHSLERSPLGFDTDSANDFIEMIEPTPGK